MAYLSDIEIAQQAKMKPITEIAEFAGIDKKYLEQYGNYKAKIDLSLLKESNRENGKLILESQLHRSWTPYNNNPGVTIKKGKNHMIFKITRTDEFKFSWSVRNSHDMARLYHKTENPVK